MELWGLFVNDQPIYPYFLEIKEQIRQDSILAGNNIIKSLILEYAIIKQNARRNASAKGFPVHESQKNIDSKSSQIIAIETMMQSTYTIASEKHREE